MRKTAAIRSQTLTALPTEFPRDDQLESQLKSAQETYNRIQAHMNTQSQAVNLLGQADKAMASCLQSMSTALGYSSWGTQSIIPP